MTAPTSPHLHGGDVAIYVFDIKSTELAHSFFYSVLVSILVFMALSTVFHLINFPDNSPFLGLFFQPYFGIIDPFNCVSVYENLPHLLI